MARANESSLSKPAAPLYERVEKMAALLGDTPMVRLEHAGIDLFAKLESFNLVGSVKDRAAFWVLKSAIERGEIDERTTIVESSSGNFAAAMAFFCKKLGLRFIPVVDPNISKVYEATLHALCDTVVKVTTRDDTGGFLKTRLRKVAEICASEDRSFWPNQYENPDIAEAHYRFAGSEIAKAVPRLDYAFIGVGSGGTMAGVSRRLKKAHPGVKIVAVDAEGSVIFGGAPKKRYIPGLGSSIVPGMLKHAHIDEVITIPEIETVAGCRLLRDRHELFMGGSSGTVFAAVLRYFGDTPARNKPAVAFICPDGGRAYADTIYNDSWVQWLKKAHTEQSRAKSTEAPRLLSAA